VLAPAAQKFGERNIASSSPGPKKSPAPPAGNSVTAAQGLPATGGPSKSLTIPARTAGLNPSALTAGSDPTFTHETVSGNTASATFIRSARSIAPGDPAIALGPARPPPNASTAKAKTIRARIPNKSL
jgi:hypothetical protein